MKGHGTAVASLIGGNRFGVAKEVSLKAVRVTDLQDDSGMCTMSRAQDALAGIVFVRKDVRRKWRAQGYRPAVANLSIGYPQSRALDKALQQLIAIGVPAIVAGAERDNSCEESPGRLPEAITVGGAFPQNDAGVFGGGPCTDLFAPTGGLAASKTGDNDFQTGLSGTSGAAPLVTGTVAIFLGQHPNLGANPSEIPGIVTRGLLRTATTVPTLSPDKLLYSLLNFGAGNPTVDRTAISFTTPVETNPPSIALQIASSVPGEPVEYWLSLAKRSCWLKVHIPPVLGSCSPALTAPAAVQVSVDVTSPGCMLGPNTYDDLLQVSGTNLGASITIPVTLQVTAGP